MVRTSKILLVAGMVFLFCFFSLIIQCDWIYTPKEMEAIISTTPEPDISKVGKFYKINKEKQTCNPSISQNLTSFPACMLWLNFGGSLVVNVPDSMPEYTLKNILQHDRLTITDTLNTVRWFILRENLSIPGELQDPEWTTHPDYITFLGKDKDGNADGYIIRLSDKASIKINEDKLTMISTPHAWIPDSAIHGQSVSDPEFDKETGFLKKEFIEKFFGTSQIKITVGLEKQKDVISIHYIDYSSDTPKPIALTKPEGMEQLTCESALISPDGYWVVYNCKISETKSDIYMQKLSVGSKPILITENTSEPHWWIDPIDPNGTYYVVYTTINGNKTVLEDLTDPSFAKDGSIGKTLKQKLIGSAGDVPAHMGLRVDQSFKPEVIVNLPFKGGLSRDGRFLSTGYTNTYLLQLP